MTGWLAASSAVAAFSASSNVMAASISESKDASASLSSSFLMAAYKDSAHPTRAVDRILIYTFLLGPLYLQPSHSYTNFPQHSGTVSFCTLILVFCLYLVQNMSTSPKLRMISSKLIRNHMLTCDNVHSHDALYCGCNKKPPMSSDLPFSETLKTGYSWNS